jgi:hypothetical protein
MNVEIKAKKAAFVELSLLTHSFCFVQTRHYKMKASSAAIIFTTKCHNQQSSTFSGEFGN